VWLIQAELGHSAGMAQSQVMVTENLPRQLTAMGDGEFVPILGFVQGGRVGDREFLECSDGNFA
jgi:hypothetical protein